MNCSLYINIFSILFLLKFIHSFALIANVFFGCAVLQLCDVQIVFCSVHCFDINKDRGRGGEKNHVVKVSAHAHIVVNSSWSGRRSAVVGTHLGPFHSSVVVLTGG